MDIEWLREFCLSKPGTEETLPFDEDTLVFKVGGKMFALANIDTHPMEVSLKCDPEWAAELREQHSEAIKPGYHLSKKHWNTVYTGAGGINKAFLEKLVNHSYDLVFAGLTKAIKQTISIAEGGEAKV